MHLVVGLGNPGKKYERTRHNVGWFALDEIIDEYKLKEDKEKFQAQVYKGTIAGEKVIVIKPLTFMNESGKAVARFVNFYKIPMKNVLVLHDDLDMEPGKVRVKSESGDGGHNGIRSINSLIKNDYIRIKIGIGHPGDKDSVHDYVLKKFSNNDMKLIEQANKSIAKLFEYVISGDLDKFKGDVNNTLV
jgi:peptidyl-tRNA hydrolase, PTH1 family